MIAWHFGPVVGDAAVLKHEDPIGEVENAIVVGHDDTGAVLGNGDFAQEIHNAPTRARIKRGGWLIAHNKARFVNQCARNCDALLLTTGKLLGQFVGLIRDVELGQQFDCFLACLIDRHAFCDQGDCGIRSGIDRGDKIVLLEDEADVLEPEIDQFSIAKTVYVSAEHLHFAFGGPQDPAHDRDQRCFARPAFSDDVSHFAGLDVGVNAVQHAQGRLPGLEIANDPSCTDGRFRRAAPDCARIHGLAGCVDHRARS